MTQRWPAGTRLRCVDAGETRLRNGQEYVVELQRFGGLVELIDIHGEYLPFRFKPVVRVKAKCVPTLDLLLKRSAAAFKAMSPDEQDAMHQAQRESWARGEMALGL